MPVCSNISEPVVLNAELGVILCLWNIFCCFLLVFCWLFKTFYFKKKTGSGGTDFLTQWKSWGERLNRPDLWTEFFCVHEPPCKSSSDPSNVSFFEAYLCLLNNLNEKQNPCSHSSFFKIFTWDTQEWFFKAYFSSAEKRSSWVCFKLKKMCVFNGV